MLLRSESDDKNIENFHLACTWTRTQEMDEMSIFLKTGSLAEFFDSLKHTAQELDNHQTITPKRTIWMETADLSALLKPQRTELLC